MNIEKVLKRSEVPEEFKWDLTPMFPSDEAWEAEFEAMRAVPEKIAAFQGKLGESAKTLLEYFKLSDEIEVRLSKLYGYASCSSDGDTADGAYQNMRSKALNTYVALLRGYGPPNAADLGYQDNLDLFRKGRCAIWADSTAALIARMSPSA